MGFADIACFADMLKCRDRTISKQELVAQLGELYQYGIHETIGNLTGAEMLSLLQMKNVYSALVLDQKDLAVLAVCALAKISASDGYMLMLAAKPDTLSGHLSNYEWMLIGGANGHKFDSDIEMPAKSVPVPVLPEHEYCHSGFEKARKKNPMHIQVLFDLVVGHAFWKSEYMDFNIGGNITVDVVKNHPLQAYYRDVLGCLVYDHIGFAHATFQSDKVLANLKPSEDSKVRLFEQETDFEALTAYDSELIGTDRADFLRILLRRPDTDCWIISTVENEAKPIVQGYCIAGETRIYTLYAKNLQGAQDLLAFALNRRSGGRKMTIELKRDNPIYEMIQKLEGTSCTQMQRLATRGVPRLIKYDQIFAGALGLHIV